MKGKMYRLTGTGLFGKHSNGRFGANSIPQLKRGGKAFAPSRAKGTAGRAADHPVKPSKT